MIRTACLAAAAAFLLAAPSTASAYWGCYGGCGYPWGYNYTYNYGVGYVPPPPYYSVFPPVYYSPHITARHYGASPFAWPAGMQPITYVPWRAPTVIRNPNVKAPAEKPDGIAKAGKPQPMMIENPYVAGAAPVQIDNPYVASTSR
jgi:hypothetical protein